MISVIMPTYNRASVISRAIKSVLSQTYSDFELIIVDDGSTDDTKSVVSLFDDSRILYHYYSDNQGANHARNVGLKHSRGDIIAFLDSDNEWDFGYLKLQETILKSEDYDVAFCKYVRSYDGRESRVVPDIDSNNLELEEISKRMVQGNIMDTNVTCIKREIYLKCGGFDERLKRFQDWDYFLTLIENNSKIKFSNVIQSHNYTMEDSISLRDEYRDHAFALILRKHKCFFENEGYIGLYVSTMFDLIVNGNFPQLYEEISIVLHEVIPRSKTEKIILYGYGNRGKLLFNIMRDMKIDIAIVDKYCLEPIKLNVTFRRDISDIRNIDCIVVTVGVGTEDIIAELRTMTDAPIFDISGYISNCSYYNNDECI